MDKDRPDDGIYDNDDMKSGGNYHYEEQSAGAAIHVLRKSISSLLTTTMGGTICINIEHEEEQCVYLTGSTASTHTNIGMYCEYDCERARHRNIRTSDTEETTDDEKEMKERKYQYKWCC